MPSVTAPPASPAPSEKPTPTARPAPSPAPDKILITSNADFYKQSYSAVPNVDPSSWSLTINGLVSRPLTLTLDEVRALSAVEIMRTLECIGNPVGGPLIGNAVWKGTYLKPLLDEVGIQSSAIRIKFEAADGYHTAVDLKFIDDPRSFLAYEMNGEPLSPEHGFPLRLFFPGSYGQKMPKWVTRLELIDYAHAGYWEGHGWSDTAQVKTNSIIDEPHTGAMLATGTIPIYGVAYAGQRDIVNVDVKIGDDEWREAQLLHGPTNEVWTQWSLDWTPPQTGNHKISVRATDATGFTQWAAAKLLDVFPAGSDAIHSIFVKVVA